MGGLQLAGPDNSNHNSDKVERRKGNPLVAKKDSRPSSVIADEPLLDPQLAAMLEARKIKAGESPGNIHLTAILLPLLIMMCESVNVYSPAYW